MKKRIASIWLPHWPSDRLQARRKATTSARSAAPNRSLVLTIEDKGAVRIFACDARAAGLGLHSAMTLSDARAAVPDIEVRAADPEEDAKALTRLAHWCRRWSPRTAPEAAGDGILIDATGCAHLFGGEEAMLVEIQGALAGLGLDARLVLAATHGLAWGAVRFDPDMARRKWRVIPDQETRAALDRLPVGALGVTAETAAALRRLGLKHIGALTGRPRAPLARRFGIELLRRLDRASGFEPDPFHALEPPPRFRETLSFPEPLLSVEAITLAAARALEGLCASFVAEAQGARRIALTLHQANGTIARYQAGVTRAVCDPGHLARLLGERLAQQGVDPGFGIDVLEVAALRTGPLDPRQAHLDGREEGEKDIAHLIDALEARIGEGRVLRAGSLESHRPERAAFWAPRPGEWQAAARRARPLLMLSQPESIEAIAEVPDGPPRAFTWRKVRHRIARADGPERIAPEWWRDDQRLSMTRDYFHVETEDGRRFWLFRDGLYGQEADKARWFLHGAGP